jgi:hypothetical protein
MGYDSGLFSQQQMHTLKAGIRDHTNESKNRTSSFISFIASLLTTLQRAVWHKEKGYSNIYVAVFDTPFLGEQDVILPISILVGAFNILVKRQYINLDCAEEYLVWEQIKLGTDHIRLDELERQGLYKLVPELTRHNQYLGSELPKLRAELFPRQESTTGAAVGTNLRFSLCRQLGQAFRTKTCSKDAKMIAYFLALRGSKMFEAAPTKQL